MPLHIAPVSRRDFLIRSTAALTSVTLLPTGWAAESSDANRFALLSDTHIPERAEVEARGVNMTANLRRVVAELCALEQKPAGVIINGDCAYLKGLPQDYANFAQCVAPLTPAGLPLHVTMGNHDDREPFYGAIAAQRPENPPVQSKHVSVIQTPHANLFLLDSLFQVNVVTGELGDAQRNWLAQALDAHSDKPAIVVAHHNLQFQPPADGAAWGGLRDTDAFFELLKARPQVKAYIFGHSHNWSLSQRDGIHLINLPPVAYVFAEDKPNGWVDARLHPDAIELKLNTFDPQHPQAGEQVRLAWA